MSAKTSGGDQNTEVRLNSVAAACIDGDEQRGVPESRKQRIREAIDSADRFEAGILLSEAKAAGGIVPIAALAIYCDGNGFIDKYYDCLPVTEEAGRFWVNLSHFYKLKNHILSGSSPRELKKVAKNNNKKLSYKKNGITITQSGNADRVGKKWYFRKQIRGVRRYFELGYNRTASHKLATEIVADIKAKKPLIELLRKYKEDSPELEDLEAAESRDGRTVQTSEKSDEARIAPIGSKVTIMELMMAYQEGSKIPTNGLNEKNARRCVNQLRKVICLGLKLKLPKNNTKKEIEAAERRAFERSVSELMSFCGLKCTTRLRVKVHHSGMGFSWV